MYPANEIDKLRDMSHLVVDFVNTSPTEEGGDVISTPHGLSAWLRDRGLLAGSESVSLEDTARAVEFRDALRELVGTHSGGTLSAGAIEALGRAGRAAPLRVAAGPDGRLRLEGASPSPLERAMGQILAAAFTAAAGGTWSRIKLCQDPRCGRAFYDRSRNRSGRWCAMAVCGNRAKARRYRARRRAGGVAT